jgi:hypothetical protein
MTGVFKWLAEREKARRRQASTRTDEELPPLASDVENPEEKR